MVATVDQLRGVPWDKAWLLLLLCERARNDLVVPDRESGEDATHDLSALKESIAQVEPMDIEEYAPYLDRLGITSPEITDFCGHLQQRAGEAVDLIDAVERGRRRQLGPA